MAAARTPVLLASLEGYTGDLPLLDRRFSDGSKLARHKPPSPPPSPPPLPPRPPPAWQLDTSMDMGHTPLDRLVAKYTGEWFDRFDEWWLKLDDATLGRLERCIAFLGGAITARFGSFLGRVKGVKPSSNGGGIAGGGGGENGAGESGEKAADADCQHVVEQATVNLPEFPDDPPAEFWAPTGGFFSPNLPNLLPPRLGTPESELIMGRHDATFFERPNHAIPTSPFGAEMFTRTTPSGASEHLSATAGRSGRVADALTAAGGEPHSGSSAAMLASGSGALSAVLSFGIVYSCGRHRRPKKMSRGGVASSLTS